ncbi:MAG: cyclic pyranopterin monophosphate synthase MoaC [Gammaproteobacteria bacterium]|nr:MAG: cyclic pyranopterin monophosphate synthase MoaC [Gammaproteobacteria bacterium]TDJ40102.1 MAG: cyclic pyranopterin monophosphate synthase MoaC [Gammaproteobacteria bacterium]
MSRLSHVNDAGEAHMVDVSGKPETSRRAVAESRLRMRAATLREITGGGVPKGDVFAAARIAGIQGAKRTSELIPLCHPLPLSQVEVEFDVSGDDPGEHPGERELVIRCTCRVNGRTGVEMEALTGASVAALTVYDMCKAIDRGMSIVATRLLIKEGGKSGTWTRDET